MSGKRLHIVGIGVSTGALEALSTLLATLRPGCDTAYVVLAHLSPDHASHLPDLLQRACALPVHAISATQELKADQVYVLPPAANVEAIDTHLRLTPLEPVRVQRAPIDHFFRSMAHVHDGAGVAVVLTGQGSDGSRGVRSVRGAGGLVIAQSPVEAEAPGMPRSAIATGMVDLVLRLDQMAEAFGRFCHANPLLTVPGSPAVAAIDADCYQEIRELLRGGDGDRHPSFHR